MLKRKHVVLSLILLLPAVSFVVALALSSMANSAPTLEAKGASVGAGQTVPVSITLTSAPDGVAGFELVVTLSNASVASITSVELPDFGLARHELVSSSEVRIIAVDIRRLVEQGASNAALATLTVQGLAPGTSTVSVRVDRLEDDAGEPLQPRLLPGVVTVSSAQG